ncbi:Oral cancer-overexpressed protein 1 [Blattella germanica]|nr:Oral cancer-overexpressed protein 1 [Blattella germanica]
MDNQIDINDAFDSIALSEERISNEGYSEGFSKGVLEGEVEGFHLGYHRGAEIGAELGYYKGIVETILKERETSEKEREALRKVIDLVNQFPSSNKDDIDLVECRDEVRVRFKKACALLKLNLAFSESSNLSF